MIRLALALVSVYLASGCAAHAAAPPPPAPTILIELLPPGTRLCTRRNPIAIDCLTIEQFRALVRGLRNASFGAGS